MSARTAALVFFSFLASCLALGAPGCQSHGVMAEPSCVETGCDPGFVCTDGQCVPNDGAACTVDGDCASQLCLLGTCARACGRDADCSDGQTCGLNALGPNGAAPPSEYIRPACVPRRNTAAPGAACASDADCDRGTCQLGICVELCAAAADCHASGMTCAHMLTVLDNESLPTFDGCLPATGTLEFPDDKGYVPLPSNAQSFAIYSRLETFDFTKAVGVTLLTDPTDAILYQTPQTVEDWQALPVRYLPAESTSTMLVPNSPRVTLMPGAYTYRVDADGFAATQVRLYLKLGDQPIATGKLALNFYLTDLSSNCTGTAITTANAATVLAKDVSDLKAIYASAGVTIDEVTFHATTAANVVKNSNTTQLPDLDDVLQAATDGQGTTPGIDLVLVRSITDENGQQSGVLGIAGGIPGSPVNGTPHSGAAVSVANLCYGGDLLGSVAAHEAGHTLGLFHNIESDESHDPLTDTMSDGQNNLMYWSENGGRHVTAQQAQVIRNNPKVRP